MSVALTLSANIIIYLSTLIFWDYLELWLFGRISASGVTFSLIPCIFMSFISKGKNQYSSHVTSVARDLLLLTACILLSVILAGLVNDSIFDSLSYHQEEILQMKLGWNPIFREQPLVEEALLSGWVKRPVHYFPKVQAFGSLPFYLLTGNIESGKAFIVLLQISCALLCFHTMRVLNFHWVPSLACTLLVIFNPIFFQQFGSYKNDQVVGAIYTSSLALGICCFLSPKRIYSLLLILLIGLGCGIKYTMTSYFIVSTGTLISIYLLNRDKRYFRLFALMLIGLIYGLIFINFYTYPVNLVKYKNLFHHIEIGNVMKWDGTLVNERSGSWQDTPEAFRPLNAITKFIYSHLGATSSYKKTRASIKNPFQVTQDEIKTFTGYNQAGGFGPFFPLLVYLSLILFLYLLFFRRRLSKDALWLLVIIMLCTLSNLESWRARYVPQLWLLPALAAFTILYLKPRSIMRLPAYVCMLLLFINSLLSTGSLVNTFRKTRTERKTLQRIAMSQRRLPVLFGHTRAYRARLDYWGIDYYSEDIKNCKNIRNLCSAVKYCERNT